MLRYVPFSAALAALFATVSASAQSQVTLSYDAAEGCPAEATFRAAVAARGGSFDAAGAARAGSLDVSIRRSAAGFAGELRVDGGGGPSAVRHVDDPECAEVVEGLAVVAAIALGARAEGAAEPAEPASTPPADSAAASPAPSKEATPPATPAPPAQPKARRLRGKSFGNDEAVTVEKGTLRFERVRSITLSGGANIGLIPDLVVPQLDFDIAAAEFVTTPSGWSRLVGTILRARWRFIPPITRESGDYSTDIWGLAAGVSACSAITYDSRGLSVLFCSEFGLSAFQLDTESADGSYQQSKEAGQGYAAIEAGAQYNFGELFHGSLRLGGQFQVGDLSAQRADGSDLFKGGLFSGYANLGVGLHF